MAKVKRTKTYQRTATSSAAGTGTTTREKFSGLSTEKHKPPNNIGDYNLIIYGEPKVGKTTLAGQFPDAYFMLFEPNDSYEIYKSDIQTWDQFEHLVDEFLAGNHDYKTVVIDGLRIAYDLALEYAGKKHGFEHPGGQNDFGQSWAKVKQEFQAPIRRLLSSKYGVIFVCHEVHRDIEKASGRTFTKVMPDLQGQAREFVVGLTYNIFHYHYEGEGRFLQIQGDEYIQAGNRMSGHFLTPSGEPVQKIPMGESEQEAYKNLIAAFHNKQKITHLQKGKEKKKYAK